MLPLELALAVGYRIADVRPVSGVGVREAFVVNPDDEWVSETNLRARAALGGNWALDVSFPVVAAWRNEWSEVGPGVAILAARHWIQAPSRSEGGARALSLSMGLEVGVGVSGAWSRPAAWGSSARETTPSFVALALVEIALPPGWLIRTAFGVQGDPAAAEFSFLYDAGVLFGSSSPALHAFWSAEVIGARVVELTPVFDAVFEAELSADATPFSIRILGRSEIGSDAVLDLGLQVPVFEYVQGPSSIQLLAAFCYAF